MKSKPLLLLALLLLPGLAQTSEAPAASLTHGGVRAELHWRDLAEESATLALRLTPIEAGTWHLYALQLPEGGPGVATAVVVPEGQWAAAAGPLQSPTPVEEIQVAGGEALPVFADGAVELRLPLRLAPAGQRDRPLQVLLSYMACNDKLCLMPALGKAVAVPPPGGSGGRPNPLGQGGLFEPGSRLSLPTAAKESEEPAAEPVPAPPAAVAVALPAPRPGPAGLDWHDIGLPAQVEGAVTAALAGDGPPVFLDFTGPSCVNCRVDAETVFPLPAVKEQLQKLRRLALDTDRHPALADYQRRRYGTTARPLYVRIDAEGERRFEGAARGSEEAFTAFLAGGAGKQIEIDSWGSLIFLAILGGLLTLLMPCTYPMIPLTINVFSKRAGSGRSLWPMASAYAIGIVVSFVGIGLLAGLLFDVDATRLSSDPLTNLLIAVVFVVLGLSLIGIVPLRLPSSWQTRAGRLSESGGYLAALLMGLTFAITAFTCTAPIAGVLLAGGMNAGDWWRTTIGMAIYALAIAIPFMALAMSPGLLARLPKSGTWMEELKWIGGLVEISAALKFLSVTDVNWGWNLLSREMIFGAWALAALAVAALLAGVWRPGGLPPPTHKGLWRWLSVALFATLGLWLAWGVGGGHLGTVEGWLAAPTTTAR